jgi:hypothetical protein
MNNPEITFYGSREDLDALKKALTDAKFQEIPRGFVYAHDPTGGGIIPPHIIFAIYSIHEMSKCIRVYLKERSKRMIRRDGGDFVIKGNFTSSEFQEQVETCGQFTIEDEKHDG